MKKYQFLLLVVVLLSFLDLTILNNKKMQNTKTDFREELVKEDDGNVPMSFEENRGQTDARVKFLSRGKGYNLFLTSTEASFVLRDSASQTTRVLGMKLANISSEPKLVSVNELLGKTNYLIGNDPSVWKTDIPAYAKMKYQAIYPGIDLVFYGNKKQLEYDFVVSPGIDPKLIEFALDGVDSSRIDNQGNLVLNLDDKDIQFQKPYIYQESNGVRESISGGYALKDTGRISFNIGPYDATRTLWIDPVLVYSTYLGGSGGDGVADMAVDSSGNVYITGRTTSLDFPTTTGTFQTASVGNFDAFVTKLDSSGSAIIYSTYIGGSNSDVGQSISVDTSGNAYIVGYTDSLNFPLQNALQSTFGGGSLDDFLTKLNPSGSALVFSTYIGGSGNDSDVVLTIDNSGTIYVTGDTTSSNLPTTLGVFQPFYGGGTADAYIAKLNSTGSSFIFLTYLGGSDLDDNNDIGIDEDSNIYLAGSSASPNFPVTLGSFQAIRGGGGAFDAYIAKLNSTATALVYSSYLGGSGDENGSSVAVDTSGNAYVTGFTTSANFPTTPGAFQTNQDNFDAFVTKVNPSGSALIYSTYLGGSNDDIAGKIILDSSGNAYVAGYTNSASFFPTTPDAIQPIIGGGIDAFVSKLNQSGSSLLFSTYLGGSNNDFAGPIALDTAGNLYVAGTTLSSNFPVTTGAFQTTYAGGASDGFVTKIRFNQPPIANAGPDQTVVVKNLATLDGSASFDPDFVPITYQWSENSGNPEVGILSSNTAVNPTFTPQIAGIYTFSLVVNDGFVDSPPDTILVTAQTSVQAIQSLIDKVKQFSLQSGIEKSVLAKLNAAIQTLSDTNMNNDTAAVNLLQAFINEVEAQRGIKITNTQADELVSMAQAIAISLLVS